MDEWWSSWHRGPFLLCSLAVVSIIVNPGRSCTRQVFLFNKFHFLLLQTLENEWILVVIQIGEVRLGEKLMQWLHLSRRPQIAVCLRVLGSQVAALSVVSTFHWLVEAWRQRRNFNWAAIGWAERVFRPSDYCVFLCSQTTEKFPEKRKKKNLMQYNMYISIFDNTD